MGYMPLTLIATLSASLAMALLFVPVLGSLIGKPLPLSSEQQARIHALEEGDFSKAQGITKAYVNTLSIAIRHPVKILIAALLVAVGVGFTYAKSGWAPSSSRM